MICTRSFCVPTFVSEGLVILAWLTEPGSGNTGKYNITFISLIFKQLSDGIASFMLFI